MVGAVSKPNLFPPSTDNATPQVFHDNPGFIIDDKDNPLSMVPADPAPPAPSGGDDKKLQADAEKQPLSGVKEERWYTTLMQVAVPFFIAGIGTIGAGIVLGTVKSWEVFLNVSAIFVLVPSLSGLKGNLDMCLASRLSTQANCGNMTSFREISNMVVGNISLVQIQAIVAATIVALFAIVVNTITDRDLQVNNVLLLISSAIFTATTTCFVLDFVLVVVILCSHRLNVNPDNVATPLAASIGDVVSNTVLAFTAQYMYDAIKVSLWQPITLIVIYFCMLPVWVYIVMRNKYTKKVLTTGWTPVISALFISGVGGIVLDNAIDRFNGYEVFQPIVNGIGGNLVSVQSSRISTYLHQTALPGILPEGLRLLEWPWKTLFVGTRSAKTARMLIALSIVGHIIFMVIADFIYMKTVTIQAAFAITYIICCTLQVMVLLYCAYVMVHYMWKRQRDPDNAAIPYLTALGDLLGSVFLGLAFVTLTSFGKSYGDNV